MDDMAEMIECNVLERKSVIMMGDFNCDMLQPNSCACTLAMVMSEYMVMSE